MAVNLVSLVFDVYDAQEKPLTYGTVTCSLNTSAVAPADRMVISPAPVQVPFGPGGSPVQQFLANDSSGPMPQGSAWNLHFDVPGKLADYSVHLFAGPATFTATNATPAVFTWTATTFLTSLPNGTGIKLAGGSLPAGFSATPVYYVVNASGQTFQLSAAQGGPAIASTSSGGGTLTVTQYNLSALSPSGSVAAVLPYMLTPSGTAAAGQVPKATGVGSQSAWGDVAGPAEATFATPGLMRQTEFNIADYGATGDAYLAGTTSYNTFATDNTTFIRNCYNAAAAAGGGVVVWPDAAFMHDQVTIPDNVSSRGISRKGSVSVLKPNSAAGGNFISAGFGTGNAATGSDDSWAGISYVDMTNMTIDGNQVSQASASGQSDYRNQFAGLKLYAWHFNLDLEMRNFKENGLYTEHAANWDDTFNQYQFAESRINLFIKNFGGAGWVNRGPHDSHGGNVYISSYNAGGTSAYAGYVQQGNGNYGSSGMVFDVLHCWGQFSTNAVYVSGSNILSGFIYAEGSTQSAILLSGVFGSKFTATVGYCAAGVELAAGSSSNEIEAGVQSNVTGGLFRLDGAIYGNRLTQVAYSGIPGGPIFDLATGGTYTGSGNSFLTGHPSAATLFSGAPNIADRVDARSENTIPFNRQTVYQLPVGVTAFKVGNAGGTPLVDAGGMQVNNVADGAALADAASYKQAVASALAPVVNAVTGTTITPSIAYGAYQVNATGACTGLLLSTGTVPGQRITILNYSQYSLTFAVAASSLVADGVSDVIAGYRAGTFWWSGFFWYRD